MKNVVLQRFLAVTVCAVLFLLFISLVALAMGDELVIATVVGSEGGWGPVIDAFKVEHPGVSIRLVSFGRDMIQRLIGASAAGQALADIVLVHETWLTKLWDSRVLYDLTADETTIIKQQTLTPVIRDSCVLGVVWAYRSDWVVAVSVDSDQTELAFELLLATANSLVTFSKTAEVTVQWTGEGKLLVLTTPCEDGNNPFLFSSNGQSVDLICAVNAICSKFLTVIGKQYYQQSQEYASSAVQGTPFPPVSFAITVQGVVNPEVRVITDGTVIAKGMVTWLDNSTEMVEVHESIKGIEPNLLVSIWGKADPACNCHWSWWCICDPDHSCSDQLILGSRYRAVCNWCLLLDTGFPGCGCTATGRPIP
jgi:hypothetical protein